MSTKNNDGFRRGAVGHTVIFWAPVAAWCGLIFTLSSIPHLATPWGGWDLILRKCAHMVEYALLFLLTVRALKKTTDFSAKSYLTGAFLFTVLYAASDEFHQSFVPGRGPSVIYVGIDSCGALAGFLIQKYVPLRRAV